MKKYESVMAVILIAALIILYNVSRLEPLNKLEYSISSHSKKHKAESMNFLLLNFLSMLPITVMSLLLYLRKGNFQIFLTIMVSFLVSQCINSLMSEVLKVLVGECRPDYYSRRAIAVKHERMNGKHLLIDGMKSFPSGHTAAAFCGFSFTVSFIYVTAHPILSRVWKRTLSLFLCPSLFCFSAAVGISRVRSNKHFVHDVVFGAIIGLINGLFFHWLMSLTLEKRRVRRPMEH